MKPRTLLYVAAALMTYACLFVHVFGIRAQSRPVPPVTPAQPSVPAAPAGAFVIQAAPIEPALPAMPALPALPALPAMPAMPAEPATPAVPEWDSDPSMGSKHWHEGSAQTCADLDIRLRDNETPAMESEEQTLTKAQAPVLRIKQMPNGGAQVQGWDKETYSVTACKFAVGSTTRQLLSQIRMSVQSGEVSVSGPSSQSDEWTVYLLVRTPRGADVEVTAHNGPISFHGVDGKITARATNGPISLKDCSGEADVSAQNVRLFSHVSVAGNKLTFEDLDSVAAGSRLRGHVALSLGEAVDLTAHLLRDGEAGGVVGGAVDPVAGAEALHRLAHRVVDGGEVTVGVERLNVRLNTKGHGSSSLKT